MKWNTYVYESPRYRQLRTRKIFALLPHECEDGKTRWLEYIFIHEIYAGNTFAGEYWVKTHYTGME